MPKEREMHVYSTQGLHKTARHSGLSASDLERSDLFVFKNVFT